MNINTATVQVVINGFAFDADCGFTQNSDDFSEISLNSLAVYFDKKTAPQDMTFLLDFYSINEDLTSQIQDAD